MKLCYIILFHKNPGQLFRLVDRLSYKNDPLIVIHVCKNVSDEINQEIKAYYTGNSNVLFSKREYGNWGEFGLVKGALNSFRQALEKQPDLDYITLMSGAHYPIKSNQFIDKFLNEHKGKEFMYHFPLFPDESSKYFQNHPWGSDRQTGRYEYRFIKIGKKRFMAPDKRYEDKSLFHLLEIYRNQVRATIKTGNWKEETITWLLSVLYRSKRKFPPGLVPYGGSDWFTISAEFTKYLLSIQPSDPFYRLMATSLLPVEIFYHTLLMNSPFKEHAVNNNLTHIDWSDQGYHPSTLTISDFESLKNSDKLFARKFDPETDEAVLDRIDQELLDYYSG